jgi:hypothetical protein
MYWHANFCVFWHAIAYSCNNENIHLRQVLQVTQYAIGCSESVLCIHQQCCHHSSPHMLILLHISKLHNMQMVALNLSSVFERNVATTFHYTRSCSCIITSTSGKIFNETEQGIISFIHSSFNHFLPFLHTICTFTYFLPFSITTLNSLNLYPSNGTTLKKRDITCSWKLYSHIYSTSMIQYVQLVTKVSYYKLIQHIP